MMNKPVKAIALISGGLDSALAAKVVMDQGVEVVAFNCRHPFHPRGPKEGRSYPEQVAESLGIKLIVKDVSEKIIELVKHPRHGYGRHLNPCIDCRILYLKEAAAVMDELGAAFLITGEVLGQRPKSQRRDALSVIERDSGLKGLILRPLSAKHLPRTIPEEKGWVDREKLLDIAGRGRKKQMELARKWGISGFSTPAGGCLLTMEDFARKMKDLLDSKGSFGPEDVELLKRGRHFRLSPKAKLVAGKNEGDNKSLLALAREGDFIITPESGKGPVGLVRGEPAPEDLEKACSILAYYTKAELLGDSRFSVERVGSGESEVRKAAPLTREQLEQFRI